MNIYIVEYKSFTKTKSIVVEANSVDRILKWLNKDDKYKEIEYNIYKSDNDEVITIEKVKKYILEG